MGRTLSCDQSKQASGAGGTAAVGADGQPISDLPTKG